VAVMIRPAVLRMFTENPGEILYVDDMAQQLDIKRRAITACVYNMRRNTPLLEQQIEVIIHGNAWRYMPPSDGSTTAPTAVNGASVATVQPTVPAPLTAPSASTTADRPLPSPPLAPPSPNTGIDGFAASPTSGPSARIFEELGTSADGRILVVDEESNTYWLLPIMGRSAHDDPVGRTDD
jgi:hypothetical protein